MKLVPTLLLVLFPAVSPAAPTHCPTAPTHCPVQDGDVVQTEADTEVKERRKVYEDVVEGELAFAWSEHFLVLVDSKKAFKFGKKKLAGEELAAAVVRYCEPLFADYCERYGAKPREDFRHRTEILLWDDAEKHLKVAKDVLEWTPGEETNDWPVRRGGDRGTYSVVLGSMFAKDSTALERRLVHNVTRALLSAHAPSSVLTLTGNCWLSLGVGMLAEDRHCGMVNSVDNKNLLEELPRKKGKWRGAVRKLVDKDKVGEFQDLVQTTEVGFQGDSALVAASLVEFLESKDAKQFHEFCLHIKSRTPTRDAVQVVYGFRDDQFEEAWSEWVQETYSKR